MPTTSPPILIYTPGGGVPIGPVSNPPVYSQAGTTQLVEGQAYIDVVFGSVQTTDDWVLVECIVVNEIDADPLNIWPGIITDKTAAGFRLQLNGLPDSGNYYLHWAVSGVNIKPSPATTYSLTGSSSGGLSVASSVFTVALPPSTTLATSVTVTPDDGGGGGTFTPSSVTLTTSSPSKTFTYTPASYGDKTISTTNGGPLSNPASIVFTCISSTYTLSGPSTGAVSVASTDFTAALPVGGAVLGTVTVTPHDGGGGGTFTPTSVGLTTAVPSATFTYTPATGGAKTISVTNDGGLTDPGNLTYTVSVPATPHLLDTLISYWKLDEASSATRNDSQGTNHLTDTGGVTGVAALINNGAYRSGVGAIYLSRASNSTLQVTSDFTFSMWARVDDPTTQGVILGKTNNTFAVVDYVLQHVPSPGFQFNAGGTSVAVGSPVAAFAVCHVVVWFDSSDGKLHMRINDATTYDSAATATLTQSTEPFGILANGLGQLPWVGWIDEVGFWKRVLTAGEITALYNSGAGLPFSSFTV